MDFIDFSNFDFDKLDEKLCLEMCTPHTPSLVYQDYTIQPSWNGITSYDFIPVGKKITTMETEIIEKTSKNKEIPCGLFIIKCNPLLSKQVNFSTPHLRLPKTGLLLVRPTNWIGNIRVTDCYYEANCRWNQYRKNLDLWSIRDIQPNEELIVYLNKPTKYKKDYILPQIHFPSVLGI